MGFFLFQMFPNILGDDEPTFHIVLQVLAAFAKETTKTLLFGDTPLEILKNLKYYPWFKVSFIDRDIIRLLFGSQCSI